MLPAALVRVRVDGCELRPVLVDLRDRRTAEAADLVFGTWAEGAARSARVGEVAAEIDELCAERTDGKLVRGLSRVCADRAVAADHLMPSAGRASRLAADHLMPSAGRASRLAAGPRGLRAAVFRQAAQVGPLAVRPDPFNRPTAASVLEAAGASPADLYADLPSEQRIRALRVPDTRWLVDRYNVATCQSVLVHATELLLTVREPGAPRLRQLFRWAKFHQLLCAAVTKDDGSLVVRFDGPASVLGGSTRYGQQLARFLPAILLQPDTWTLEAKVSWTKRRVEKTITLTSADGLRTHLRDDGAWRGKTHAALVAGFEHGASGWTLTDGLLPLQIGPRELCFPDFVLSDGRVSVRLELLGYWRAAQITRRLDAMDRYGCRDLLLAVSRRLCAERGIAVPEDPRVIVYSDVVPIHRVTAAARALRTSLDAESVAAPTPA
jgi:predicted nuclease of restriction endonuclease-like RecB superfamily